ncbi:lipopolysaccharide biosynthesis protein [Rubrivirga marina]|uniref:Uncharacterized protein n=1 Tax=Rubrivirga marina TaxID=1196024 RepID=A0A271IZN7_9BACT|nr:lipopolysaccharide biosynthesis protein [Rubrivirga marina]PAP75959.1 hypothetical protein BSZ37_05650 [Rubrivirga marina]
MSLRQQAVSGVLWSALEKWGGKLFSLLVFLLLARLLSPEDFGLVALAGVFVTFAQVVVAQGLAEAIIQRDELERGHLETAFWINVATGLAATALTLLLAKPIAAGLGTPALEPILRALSPLFLLNSLNAVQTALMRRDLAFRSLAARTIGANIAGGVVGIGMAVAGYGVWSLVGQQLAAKAAEVALLWSMSQWRPGLGPSGRHARDLFGFSVHTVGISLLTFLSRHSDDLLIGYVLGPVALGYYTVAYRVLSTLLDVLTGVTRQVAFPVFSRLQQEPERLLRAFYSATRYTAFASFPTFFALAALAPEVIPVFFGPQWGPSVPVMMWLAVAGVLSSVTFFNGSVLVAVGKPSWSLFAMALSVVAAVVGFAVAVQWGIVAVAAAVAVRAYVFSPVSLWLIGRVLPLSGRAYVRQFVPAAAGSLGLVAAVVALRLARPPLPDVAFLALAGVLGSAVYLGTVQLLAPTARTEALGLLRSIRGPREAVTPDPQT